MSKTTRYVWLAGLSVILAFAGGVAIAACHQWSDFVQIAREDVVFSHRSDWQSFDLRLSWLIRARCVASDFYDNVDINLSGHGQSPIDMYAELQFGFPFHSHSCVFTRSIDRSSVVLSESGILIHNRCIPLRLNAFEFVLNSCVYFACIALCHYFVIKTMRCRNKARLRRGLRPRCKYIITHVQTCPECGWCTTPLGELSEAGSGTSTSTTPSASLESATPPHSGLLSAD